MRRAVIVGGGITGLAAARVLDAAVARGELDACLLLEAGPRLGGKILTDDAGGFLIEGGPDSFITLKPKAVQLARDLGLADCLVGTLEPRSVFIRHAGRLFPLPDGLSGLIPQRLWPFLRSPLFAPIEKMRFALEAVIPRSANGVDESLGAFVRRRLGDAAVDRLAAPLLAGIHAGDVERLSLRATFPQLGEAEQRYGSLTRAVLTRRREAPPRGSPPLPMFMTLRGGLQELVRAATGSLRRVVTRTHSAVVDLSRHNGQYRLVLDHGERIDAGAVILAVPAPAAASMLGGLNPQAASAAAAIRYVSTAAVALGFMREQVRHPLAGHGYVGSHRGRAVHTACTWVSSKWPGRAPADAVLLRCFVGRDGAQDGLERDDDDLIAAVTREISGLLGISGAPLLSRVYRWPDAMPQYDVGHLDRMAAMQDALRATPGLVAAGSGYRGVGLPDCISQGEDAARRALDVMDGGGAG